jgi:hypothetical protein
VEAAEDEQCAWVLDESAAARSVRAQSLLEQARAQRDAAVEIVRIEGGRAGVRLSSPHAPKVDFRASVFTLRLSLESFPHQRQPRLVETIPVSPLPMCS